MGAGVGGADVVGATCGNVDDRATFDGANVRGAAAFICVAAKDAQRAGVGGTGVGLRFHGNSGVGGIGERTCVGRGASARSGADVVATVGGAVLMAGGIVAGAIPMAQLRLPVKGCHLPAGQASHKRESAWTANRPDGQLAQLCRPACEPNFPEGQPKQNL